MIEQLITSSFLILAVLLLRMLLRGRVSRRMLYGLWLVVALRLLLPISISSPVSVMNAVDPSGAQQFINQQVIRVNPDLSDALSTEEDSPSREPAASPISRGMLLHAVWLGGAVAHRTHLCCGESFPSPGGCGAGGSLLMRPDALCRFIWQRISPPLASSASCGPASTFPPRRQRMRAPCPMFSPTSIATSANGIISGRWCGHYVCPSIGSTPWCGPLLPIAGLTVNWPVTNSR